MNKRKISGIIILIAAIFMIGAVKVWAPVCQKSLELANGGETHMKCFYYGTTMMYIGVLLLAEAIVMFFVKNTRAVGIIAVVRSFDDCTDKWKYRNRCLPKSGDDV